MIIENDLQLKHSKNALKDLNKILNAKIKKGVPTLVANASKLHIREMIKEIQIDIDEYNDKLILLSK